MAANEETTFTLRCDPDQAYANALRALRRAGFGLKRTDPERRTVFDASSMNLWTYGEKVWITIAPSAGGADVVHLHSQLRGLQLIDPAGRNARNLREIEGELMREFQRERALASRAERQQPATVSATAGEQPDTGSASPAASGGPRGGSSFSYVLNVESVDEDRRLVATLSAPAPVTVASNRFATPYLVGTFTDPNMITGTVTLLVGNYSVSPPEGVRLESVPGSGVPGVCLKGPVQLQWSARRE